MAFPVGFSGGERMDEAYTERAASTITANRFVVHGSGGLAVVGTAGVRADGVAEYGVAAGEAVTVFRGGEHLLESGGAVADGDKVSSDSSGRAITTTSTNVVLGVAKQSCAAAGSFIMVLLNEV